MLNRYACTPKHSDQLSGPSILQIIGYRRILRPGIKWLGCAHAHTPPSGATPISLRGTHGGGGQIYLIFNPHNLILHLIHEFLIGIFHKRNVADAQYGNL